MSHGTEEPRPQFELAISDQHWLGEPEDQSHDGCSHGRIRAVVDGRVVSAADAEYGISQSALALLRTLFRDHSPSDPVNEGLLLCHGCGYPLTFGCGAFGTDWTVLHEGETVVLREFRTLSSDGDVEFDIEARLPREVYRDAVVAFAEEAREFVIASGPRHLVDWEVPFDIQFWAEFDELLARAARR